MNGPLTPIPVALVPLQRPFSQVTFYKDGNIESPGTLWFNGTGIEGKAADTWTALAQGGSGTSIIAESITTANFWWDVSATHIAFYTHTKAVTPQEVSKLPGSSNVPIQASLVVSTTIPSSSAPNTGNDVTKTVHSSGLDQASGTTSNALPPDSTVTPASTLPAGADPTSSPTRSPTPKANGLSSGAVAGVAIGCLIAGALIAGLLAWFCLKRRKPGTVRDSEASTVALMHREKGPTTKTVSLSSGSPMTSALENGLPQPLEDKAISGEISKICNLIKNHIQSYYHNRAVSPGLIDYDDLQALGENLPVSVGTLSTLLNNPATREIALRFCLASVVTSRIRPNDSSNTTFLPPEVAKCIQSMNHLGQTSKVHSLFYTKWRTFTAELLQSAYVRNPFSPGDGRVRNIQAAAALLDSVIRPFADSRMDDGARSRNLEEILKRSAQFAFTLFSQPTAWDFDWQNEHSVKSGSLCIFPALVQVADENGEPINPPRPFSEAVNRRLDE